MRIVLSILILGAASGCASQSGHRAAGWLTDYAAEIEQRCEIQRGSLIRADEITATLWVGEQASPAISLDQVNCILPGLLSEEIKQRGVQVILFGEEAE